MFLEPWVLNRYLEDHSTMANRRMIDVSFWQSETIARLPMKDRLLFVLASDAGGRPA